MVEIVGKLINSNIKPNVSGYLENLFVTTIQITREIVEAGCTY